MKTLSRGIDYLGELGAKLRDLQGTATLAHELIQNADDAPNADEVTFDFYSDGLRVSNNGFFSDCGHSETQDCTWLDRSDRGHRCDFHRFRRVASGDKRQEAGTTGAFGIGFTAVYQITDRPELISAGRHWVIHEERPEDKRISVCDGCDRCRDADTGTTSFWLPWAADAASELRQRLMAQVVDRSMVEDMPSAFRRSLAEAAVFLKKLKRLSILKEGHPWYSVSRRHLESDGVVEVSDEIETWRWHIVDTNFRAEAEELREKFPTQIEEKRRAVVRIALSLRPSERGLFYACLPTQHQTGLPLSVDADFFPSTDRKRLVLEPGYQADWNRAAIRAAASGLAEALETLPAVLGGVGLWRLLSEAFSLHERAEVGRCDSELGFFWIELNAKLDEACIVPTSSGAWRRPSEVLLLSAVEEQRALPALEGLGLEIVHEELRPYVFSLPQRAGMEVMDVLHLAEALETLDLSGTTRISELPENLYGEDGLALLWEELGCLFAGRGSRERRTAAEMLLGECAIAPVGSDLLHPCARVYRAEEATTDLFSELKQDLFFFDLTNDAAKPIAFLCPEFSLREAIDVLSTGEQEPPHDISRARSLELVRWLEGRSHEFQLDESLRSEVASLPVFPSALGVGPLSQLSLPGGFEDPLGIADLIDVKALGGRTQILEDLGAKKLTFACYAKDHVPQALRDTAVEREKKDLAIRLLANHLGEIRDDDEVRAALASVPCVECIDGEFRIPSEVYLPGRAEELLGTGAHIASLPHDHASSMRELYTWLGVISEPRDRDLVLRIEQVTSGSVDGTSISIVERILEYLGTTFPDDEDDLENSAWGELQTMQWLPARGCTEKWLLPGEVFTSFREYLFESQAQFLELPQGVQRNAARFLAAIGVRTEPHASQVVKHLLAFAGQGERVNLQVYEFLEGHVDEADLRALEGTRCLLLDSGRYVGASDVFWRPHSFGRFRFHLSAESRKYSNLLARLGVKEDPDATDALSVLHEIGADLGAAKNRISQEDRAVIFSCWALLDDAVDDESVPQVDLEGLREVKVVPNEASLLNPPGWMFFEDRAGLAGKFEGFLTSNAIAKPLQGWRAMKAAGVRMLSSSIEFDLVECENPRDNASVIARIRERELEIYRVLSAEEFAGGVEEIDARLRDLKTQEVDQLAIRYRLRAFDRELRSKPERVQAHYDTQDSVLYVEASGGDIHWRAISRELALAWMPEREPGPVASALAQILAAKDPADASMILDELGYPPVLVAGAVPSIGGEAVGLGGTTSESIGGPPSVLDEGDAPRPTTDPVLEGGLAGQGGATDEAAESPESSASPEGASGDLGDARGEVSGDGEGGRSSGRRTLGKAQLGTGKKRQQRLRSYVSNEPANIEGHEDDGEQQERSLIEQAGVERVLEYERQAGRQPKEMPPNHPGYDVQARDEEGDVLRYIEVKARPGEWGGLGVSMTSTQFSHAFSRLRDRYWLYVVERADQDDFEIHRIHDPARRVEQFFFDDGWRDTREQDPDG